jgi:serine/threonine protein kinase
MTIDDLNCEAATLYDQAFAAGGADDENPLYTQIMACDERYSERALLARGGVKQVFRALDLVLNRHVALAGLRDEAPPMVYDAFIREARLVGQLDHPNIIKVHDIGIDAGGRPYFAMELKVGDSLEQVVSGLRAADRQYLERYPLNVRLEIFIKICDAVAYAHSKGVLHLDLKPANIQVGQFGEVIVCDWGLGKIIDGTEDPEIDRLLFNPDILNGMTLTGEIKGTPGYMAPEQVVADGVKTRQTDIYALGAILYSLVTYEVSVDGEKEEMLRKTRVGDIQMPLERCPEKDISEGLDALVRKAMALKAEDRYESVQQLRTDVHKVLSGHSVLAENADWRRELRLFYRRNRPICLVIAFAVSVVVAVTALFMDRLQRRTTEAEEASILAQRKQREAESALSRYRTEKGITTLTTENFNWVEKIYDLTDYRVYEDPISSLELALHALERMEELWPETAFVYTQRGFVYCLLQQFDKAKEAYAKYPKEFFAGLAGRYAGKKHGKTVLDVDDFIRLLDEVSGAGYGASVTRLVLCDARVRENAEERFKVAEHIFRKINPAWKGRLDYDPVRKRLAVADGHGINPKLDYPQDYVKGVGRVWQKSLCIFSTIGLKSLSLRGTEFGYLPEIKSLSLEELDLRDTRVRDLSPLKDMAGLKTVIVAPRQFTDQELDAVPAGIEVAVTPDSGPLGQPPLVGGKLLQAR